jgi:hypothetical protein
MSKTPVVEPRKRRNLKIALGALSMLVAAAGAQPPEGNQSPRSAPQAPQEGESPLQLRISAPKTTIVQCEPVPVKFELKNVSNKTLSVDVRLKPKWAQLLVEITPPGAEPYKVTYASPITERVPRDIEPKHSVTHGRLLHHHPDPGFLFKRTGQYRVHATFQDRPLFSVRSNTLVLTIVEAEGVDAKALDEHWDGNPQGQFVMGATSDYVIAREMEAILTKYPSSIYAPWCDFALARARVNRASKDAATQMHHGAKEISPILTRNAIREYERFLKKYPDFPFPYSVSMPYTVAKMKLFLGRKEEALREIDGLFKKHPEVDFLREAKRKIKRYSERGREITSAELP